MPVVHSLYREAGRVSVEHPTCTRCGECARICPSELLRIQDGCVQVQMESVFGCIACGHCMMVCPTRSISVSGRGISPSDLTPLAPANQRADANSLTALMQARRSVRRFRDEEPPLELLQRIVATAASAPMGVPPWDVGCVIIHGRDRVQSLAGQVIAGYTGLLKIIKPWLLTLMRPFVKKATYDQMNSFIVPLAKAYVAARRQGRDLLFYDAPSVLLFHHSPYAEAAEPMIACTYAMLAAESLGLGTTMIGAAAPIIMRRPDLCRRLGIPDGNRPAIALIVGYPAVHFRHGITRHFSSVSEFK